MLIHETQLLELDVANTPVVLQSKVWGVRMRWWGWVWQRPLSVQYQKSQIPIKNATRSAILTIWGVSFLVVLFSFFRERGDNWFIWR